MSIKYYIDCLYIFLYYLLQRQQLDLYAIKLKIIFACLNNSTWFFCFIEFPWVLLVCLNLFILSFAQSAGAVEYTNCFSAEG